MKKVRNVVKVLGILACGSLIAFNSLQAAPRKGGVLSKISNEPKEITKSTKTGFMLGADFGIKTIGIENDSDRFIMDFGLSMGYILYFHKSFGVRVKGDYHYAFLDLVSANKLSVLNDYVTNLNANNSHEFLFNIDALYDFYNNTTQGLSLGIFAGLGAGYIMQTTQHPALRLQNSSANVNRSGFEVVFNAGFSTIFHSKHRLDLTYRYAIITPAFSGDIITINGNQATLNGKINVPVSVPFMFNLGYSYIF